MKNCFVCCLVIVTMGSCQVSDFAEKEEANKRYEAKSLENTGSNPIGEDSVLKKKEDSLRTKRERETEQRIIFTTP